ncbi:hypothetical protein [Streptomyces sp. AC495_CC817]|uniref:hypothetical protein n=1 Tax=Streptomyces sp. AC495_CC817 TaxID=2823900 RepID=UPI001C25F68B|nr:hypothetical protein [Streptomyces sp. AC495_CC817]
MATRKHQHTTTDDLLPWIIPGAALLIGTLFLAAWLGGTLAAALTGAGWHPPPFTLTTLKVLVTDGPTTLWPTSSTGALTAGMGTVFGATLILLITPVVLITRRGGKPTGLAGRRELAALLPKGAAARARQLRPSLPKSGRLPADDTGNLLGNLEPGGPELRSSYEDVELDLMAPRAGKSTGIAVPRVLRARGSVLLTSNLAPADWPARPADRIRALPKGTALLLATGVKPALVRLRPWYAEPGADRIALAAQAEVKAITERATERIVR